MPTGISYAQESWNPWQGCHPVSDGCDNCYMYREMAEFGKDPAVVVRSSEQTFRKPHRLKAGVVFVCSWSDFFHEVADPWRPEAWDIIRACQWLTFVIITKRIEGAPFPHDWPQAFPHVWLGITAENHERFRERWPRLRAAHPAVAVVSHEPALGEIRYPADFLAMGSRACVIAGGESGPTARPSNPEWFLLDRDQCAAAGVPFYFKQWGEWCGASVHRDGYSLQNNTFAPRATPGLRVHEWPEDRTAGVWVGRRRAGRLLAGVEHLELPREEGCIQQLSLL